MGCLLSKNLYFEGFSAVPDPYPISTIIIIAQGLRDASQDQNERRRRGKGRGRVMTLARNYAPDRYTRQPSVRCPAQEFAIGTPRLLSSKGVRVPLTPSISPCDSVDLVQAVAFTFIKALEPLPISTN